MFVVIGLVVLIVFTFIGFIFWTASELPLAFREIAINSRKDKRFGPQSYSLLKILHILIKILAIFTWISGLIMSFIVAQILLTNADIITNLLSNSVYR